MIQKIEQFAAELKIPSIPPRRIFLKHREVPVHIARARTTLRPSLPNTWKRPSGSGASFLEGADIEPFLRRARTVIGISNQARTVGGKTGDLWRLPCRELSDESNTVKGPPVMKVEDTVHLPVAENVLVPGFGMVPEWKTPLITQHEPVARVEHRAAAFRRKIKGILCQVVLAGHGLRCRAGDVERGNIIDRVRPGIGSEEREAVAESLPQTGFERVVRRICNTRDSGRRRHRRSCSVCAKVHPE